MKRSAVWFVAPGQVEVREEPLDSPGEGQVLVEACLSAISSGTELLFYRGQVPEELALDGSIGALSEPARFPFKYGYSTVGCVTALGQGVAQEWLGRRVFCFHPHESAFLAKPDELLAIPSGITWENAVFLPNMETALNFCMDAAPLAGEIAGVFGLGVVGLLTTALLAQFPLSRLLVFDPLPNRRRFATEYEHVQAFDPQSLDADAIRRAIRETGSPGGLDLAVECSGSPQALNQAIEWVGFEGRVVIGSWYGKKPVLLDLGGAFHRSRIRLISSQVSTIAAGLSGRWSKARRFQAAWEQLRRIQPARWISHRFPVQSAGQAYQALAGAPGETIQVVLEYPPVSLNL